MKTCKNCAFKHNTPATSQCKDCISFNKWEAPDKWGTYTVSIKFEFEAESLTDIPTFKLMEDLSKQGAAGIEIKTKRNDY